MTSTQHEFPVVKCLYCHQDCDASLPVVEDGSRRPLGHLCESCCSEHVETEESLRARGDYS